jgi:hypothetical protein
MEDTPSIMDDEEFRRFFTSLNQLDRMFSHPIDDHAEDEEDKPPEQVDDAELDAELITLEEELREDFSR